MPCCDFFETNEAKLSSPINMAPRPLSKPPVSFSLGDEVPHIFIRESHQRPRKILIGGGKPSTRSRPQTRGTNNRVPVILTLGRLNEAAGAAVKGQSQ